MLRISGFQVPKVPGVPGVPRVPRVSELDWAACFMGIAGLADCFVGGKPTRNDRNSTADGIFFVKKHTSCSSVTVGLVSDKLK